MKVIFAFITLTTFISLTSSSELSDLLRESDSDPLTQDGGPLTRRGWKDWLKIGLKIAGGLLGKREVVEDLTDNELLRRELVAMEETEKRGWKDWLKKGVAIAQILLSKKEVTDQLVDDELKRDLELMSNYEKRELIGWIKKAAETIENDENSNQKKDDFGTVKRKWSDWIRKGVKLGALLLGKRQGIPSSEADSISQQTTVTAPPSPVTDSTTPAQQTTSEPAKLDIGEWLKNGIKITQVQEGSRPIKDDKTDQIDLKDDTKLDLLKYLIKKYPFTVQIGKKNIQDLLAIRK